MKKIPTKLKDLYIFKGLNFKDKRGYLRELTIEKLIEKLVFNILSKSHKGVLRGLHFQSKNSQGEKYVSVLKGKNFRRCRRFKKKF